MVFLVFSKMMNMRRTPARWLQENEVQEQIPPQVDEVDQVPIVGEGNEHPLELSNRDFREALFSLARTVTT